MRTAAISKDINSMKPKATDKKISPSSPNLTQIIRKSLIVYLLSAVAVPAICSMFGWRSLENIGTGFMYGSLGLALFGVLTFAGNTVPAQLSRLSLPKYKVPSSKRHPEAKSGESRSRDKAVIFLITTLVGGALLFLTGLFLKIL